MKKIKKLLAMASSLLICSSVITAFNASADDFQFSRNSEEYKKLSVESMFEIAGNVINFTGNDKINMVVNMTYASLALRRTNQQK